MLVTVQSNFVKAHGKIVISWLLRRKKKRRKNLVCAERNETFSQYGGVKSESKLPVHDHALV